MQEIDQRADEIKMLLETDVSRASTRLVEFAQDFALTPALKFKAVVIKAGVHHKPSEDGMRVLRDDISTLTTLIIEDRLNNNNSVETMSDQLRQRFMNEHPTFPVAIECNGLGKKYSNSEFKFGPIDFRFRLGEITGIVGENGHGKSTFLKMLAGLLKQDFGTIHYPILGDDAKNYNGVLNTKIAYLPQKLPRYFGTVRQNLQLAASLRGITGKANDNEVNYITHRLGLHDKIDFPCRKLSGGYELRFALAKILIWKPRVLILDEPLANLDINAQNILLYDLRYLSDSTTEPLCVIISSQHLEEVEAISDNMIVLNEGRLMYGGKTSDLGTLSIGNTFEIKTPYPLNEFRKMLDGLYYNSIEQAGFTYLVNTPASVTREQFLDYCFDNKISFSFFNDISYSVKRLILKTSSS